MNEKFYITTNRISIIYKELLVNNKVNMLVHF